jgi:alkyl hydroperoxide reductase subunit AhpC
LEQEHRLELFRRLVPAGVGVVIGAYPPSAGRNFQEILRAIDGLQLTDSEKVSTPVNWTPGDRLVIPRWTLT